MDQVEIRTLRLVKGFTIANGSVEATIDCGNRTLVGLILPNGMTGTSLTLTVSSDGSNFAAPYDNSSPNTAIPNSITYSANRPIVFTPATIAALMAFQYVKLTSNATELADRVIKAIMKDMA